MNLGGYEYTEEKGGRHSKLHMSKGKEVGVSPGRGLPMGKSKGQLGHGRGTWTRESLKSPGEESSSVLCTMGRQQKLLSRRHGWQT